MVDLYSIYVNELRAQKRSELIEERQREAAHRRFMSDPSNIDELAAGIFSAISPSSNKPNKAKYSSLTEGYDALVPSGHPLKGFGQELSQNIYKMMQDRDGRKLDPVEAGMSAARYMLSQKGKSGIPKLLEAFEYKRREEGEFFGENVRAPAVPGTINYDSWLKNIKGAEDQYYAKDSFAEEWLPTPGELAISAGVGAVAGGFTGGPPGAAIGAAAWAGADFVAKPVSNLISKTEWYRSKSSPFMVSNDLLEKVQGLAGVTAPYMVGGVVAEAKLLKLLRVPKTAAAKIAASPTARTIIDSGEEIKVADKILFKDKMMQKKLIGRFFDDRGMELGLNRDVLDSWKRIVGMKGRPEADLLIKEFATRAGKVADSMNAKAVQMGTGDIASKYAKRGEISTALDSLPEIGEKVRYFTPTERGVKIKSIGQLVKQAALKLDPIAMEEAVRNPEHIVTGIMDAYSRQTRRALFRDLNELDRTAEVIYQEYKSTMNSARIKDRANLTEQILRETEFKFWMEGAGKDIKPLPGVTPEMEKAGATLKELIGARNKLLQGSNIVTDVKASKTLAKLDKKIAALTGKSEPLAKRLPVTNATVAQASDNIAKSTGKTPKEVHQNISDVSRAAEKDPVVKDVLSKTNEPVNSEAGLSGQTSVREAVTEAKKISLGERRNVIKELAEANKKLKTAKEAAGITKHPEGSREAIEAEIRAVPREQKKAVKAAAETEAAIEKEGRDLLINIDMHEAEAIAGDLIKGFDEGALTAEETLKELLKVDYALEGSARTTEQGLSAFRDRTTNVFAHLRKMVGNKAFYAILGTSPLLINMFMPEESEAGVLSSVIKGLKAAKNVPEATVKLATAMKEAGYVVSKEITPTTFVIKPAEFQRGLVGSESGGPAAVLKNIGTWGKDLTEKGRFKFMGSYQVFQEILGVGKNLMNNPAVFKASYQAAEYNNINMANRVIDNIIRESGIKPQGSEIAKMFKPLITDMNNQVMHGWRADRVKTLKSEINNIGKRKYSDPAVRQADLEIHEAELAEHVRGLKELEGSVETFHKNYNAVAERAAMQFPEVKVALAVGDTPDFAKYPFLSKLKFSPDEEVLVGRVRELMASYKARLDGMKVKTISGPYYPHVLHPEFNVKDIMRMTGEHQGGAFRKFYSRAIDSRPLIPDLNTSLRRYAGDTERRIQNKSYWDSGWERVKQVTKDIPVISDAFKALEEGVNPAQMTFGNKAANLYSQVEAVKRLFLNPSAGLKHLVKALNDFVATGAGEATEATPGALKLVANRLAGSNPELRKSLTKLGIVSKKEQDKLMLSTFKSLVPVMGARKRMLDIGVSQQEEIFTGIKGIWQTTQNVGASWINLAELIDRGLSVNTAMTMASKKGMTMEQAMYGAYDLILKNNFLSREFNPAWMRNPKIRAALMFQGTPFKIFERRVVNAVRAGRSIKKMGKDIFEATKTPEGRSLLLRDLRNLRTYVKGGEKEIKTNLFADAIMQETDFFGTSMVTQFAKDVLLTGAATYGGAAAGVNLAHHFFHVPFVKDPVKGDLDLNLSPGLLAIAKGLRASASRDEGDTEFLFTKIMQKWMNKGPFPDTVYKWDRLNNNDIPEIYRDSKFQYLFAIPSAKE